MSQSRSSTSTSRSLLHRLRDGDPGGWDQMVELYTPTVCQWCHRTGLSSQEIPDIVQDVFQAVAGNIQTFRKNNERDTFRGWLRTITRNKIIDHHRRTARQLQGTGGTEAQMKMHRVIDSLAEFDDDDEHEARIEHQLCQRAMHRIRRHFEDHTWQAFCMLVIEDRPTHDVAAQLSMSTGAVRVAKSRVLNRLRRELGDV